MDRYVQPQRRTISLVDPNDSETEAEIKQHVRQLFGAGGMRFGRRDEGLADEQSARRVAEADEG